MKKIFNESTKSAYRSHYVKVLGAKIHYIDEGEGDPLLFLHGIPTSGYLWRNVIPHVMPYGRCIVLDLVGMGKSAKPKIPYRVFDYIRYLEGFIEALDLKNVTLVLHAWGSVIGFYYAMQHSDNVKGIAFLEAYLRSESKDVLSLSMQQVHDLMATPDKAFDLIVNSNHFIDNILPSGIMRKLTDEEMKHYRKPFKKAKYRKLLWQYLQDLPKGDEPKDVVALIRDYSKQLMDSELPKLMLYAIPGFQTTMDTIQWAKANLKKLTLIDLGEALHYPPESNPEAVGKAIATWYQKI